MKKGIIAFTAIFSAARAPAAPPSSGVMAAGVAAADAGQKQVFFELLKAYKNYPEYFKLLSRGGETFDDVDLRVVAALPDKVLKSRINQYNRDYSYDRQIEQAVGSQLRELTKRLERTPLSDLANRGDLELKVKAQQDKHKQVRRIIFMLSVDANSSIVEALQTLPSDKRTVKADAKKKPPKMPGVYGGSRSDRSKMTDAEKINLTPIDDQFYQTQLGKKLESDLGGRADYWSYDFNADELYLATDSEVSKVRVKQDSPGIRYIQTRVGSDFSNPVGSDTKVDMMQAQGRFLTGDSQSETLFGKMPSTSGSLAPPSASGPSNAPGSSTSGAPSDSGSGDQGH